MTQRTRTGDASGILLECLALGRIALGAGSVAAPAGLARTFGARDAPEVRYLTSVFGGRAIALGAAYLMAEPTERRRLQRLSLGVDISDTVAGLGALARGEQPRRAFVAMVALTGTYAAIGAARLLIETCGVVRPRSQRRLVEPRREDLDARLVTRRSLADSHGASRRFITRSSHR